MQMKPSEALMIARRRLLRGERIHICYALPYTDGGAIVRTYITKALGRQLTYAQWLRVNHEAEWMLMSEASARTARIQWIDWMIQQYKAIGY